MSTERYTFGDPIYGTLDARGRFVVTTPRWMWLRRELPAALGVSDARLVVTAIDRDAGVVTIGRKDQA